MGIIISQYMGMIISQYVGMIISQYVGMIISQLGWLETQYQWENEKWYNTGVDEWGLYL